MPNPKYAEVFWIADDVVQNAKELGLTLTKQQARSLLRANEMKIIDAMVEGGWECIERMLPENASQRVKTAPQTSR